MFRTSRRNGAESQSKTCLLSPRPPDPAINISSCDSYLCFVTCDNPKSTFLKQLRQHKILDDRAESVAVFLARLCYRPDLLGIIDRHYSTKGERGQLLDKRLGEAVYISGQ